MPEPRRTELRIDLFLSCVVVSATVKHTLVQIERLIVIPSFCSGLLLPMAINGLV